MTKGSKRVVLLLLDGVGVGALPDAACYSDEGSNTLVNLARAVGGLRLPTLERLGLGLIAPVKGLTPASVPTASYGRMAERAAGKDSITGHWELAGIVRTQPFPTYPKGFPEEIINAFRQAIGRPVLGNKAASGTAILDELGAEHMRTGNPIVYTSADSVFQIAAHEEIVPLQVLYQWCEMARQILQGPHQVARVISRPFIGRPGAFQRTPRRKDFSVPPPYPTLLDLLTEAGFQVVTVGKVDDIFCGRGIAQAYHAVGNADALRQVDSLYSENWFDFLWCTLGDFDTLYGHRNDPVGFARALEQFDNWLSQFVSTLTEGDLILISSDHGNDPTTPSTDHSREYVPVLGWIVGRTAHGRDIGTRKTFADLSCTICDFFQLPCPFPGESFFLSLQ